MPTIPANLNHYFDIDDLPSQQYLAMCDLQKQGLCHMMMIYARDGSRNGYYRVRGVTQEGFDLRMAVKGRKTRETRPQVPSRASAWQPTPSRGGRMVSIFAK